MNLYVQNLMKQITNNKAKVQTSTVKVGFQIHKSRSRELVYNKALFEHHFLSLCKLSKTKATFNV